MVLEEGVILMKKILVLAIFTVILASGLTLPVQAAPSLETYQEVINSVPSLGSSVRSLPQYLTPQKIGGEYIIAFDGTYGELEIHGNVEPESGRVTLLVIQPVAGETNTTSIASSVADCLGRKYGRAATVVPGEAYLWRKGRFQLQYVVTSGIITGNY